jgi:hypothetical protein
MKYLHVYLNVLLGFEIRNMSNIHVLPDNFGKQKTSNILKNLTKNTSIALIFNDQNHCKEEFDTSY